MRILMIHAQYTQTGGEEAVFSSEASMLEQHGHHVIRYVVDNKDFMNRGPGHAAANMIWNLGEYRNIRSLIAAQQPNIVHFHNTFPSISPSGYYAARAMKVPVVQTLHNYRLSCVNGLFFRNGQVCEDCLGRRLPWPGILHSCHPRGKKVSGMTAAMLGFHHAIRTWQRTVDCFISVGTSFAREKLIEAGIPAHKIVSKTNFLETDPGIGPGGRRQAVFAGRLTPEKGIESLLNAWALLPDSFRLTILGDGPLKAMVEEAAEKQDNIQFLGKQPLNTVLNVVSHADVMLVPSLWYEGGTPRTLIEALAVGTPAIVSDIGGLPGIISEGVSGLSVAPGNPTALAKAVTTILMDNATRDMMRAGARKEYELRFTAEANYDQLMEIYESVLSGSG